MRQAESLKPIEIRQVPQRGDTRFGSKFRGRSTLLVLVFAVPGFVMTATFAGPRSRRNLDGQAIQPTLTQFTNVAARAGITFVHFRGNEGIPTNRETFAPGVCVAAFNGEGYPDRAF